MSPDSDPFLLEMCKPLLDADLRLIEAVWADDKAAMRHRLTQMCELYNKLLRHVEDSTAHPKIDITGYNKSGEGLQIRAEAQMMTGGEIIDYNRPESDPYLRYSRWLIQLFAALESQQPEAFGGTCADIAQRLTSDLASPDGTHQHIVRGVNSEFIGVETVFTLVRLNQPQ